LFGNRIKFNSDIWIPELTNLCYEFLKRLKDYPGGRFVRFVDYIGTADYPGKIVKEYHKTAISLKKNIFGNNFNQYNIDHHKIAALYIRSFLKFQPFTFDVPKETKEYEMCLQTKLPNEYFLLVFLEAVFRAWNDDFEGFLVLDKNYKNNFIKLLYHYKKNINSLDPLTFSNTIYLIEKQYFHLSE
jgi:hypothetical protein